MQAVRQPDPGLEQGRDGKTRRTPDLLWTLQEGVGNRNVFAVEQAAYDG